MHGDKMIRIEKTSDYSLYHSSYVVDNKDDIIKHADMCYFRVKQLLNSTDSTMSYQRYNVFSLAAGSQYFYSLYKLIVTAVRDRIEDDRPLWMQCWLNYHKDNEVLGWHGHLEDFLLHGYLSIEPMHTDTEFEKFVISNKVGNLYLGKTGSEMNHRVVVKTPYDGNRITVGFDVMDSEKGIPANLSFIPIP